MVTPSCTELNGKAGYAIAQEMLNGIGVKLMQINDCQSEKITADAGYHIEEAMPIRDFNKLTETDPSNKDYTKTSVRTNL